MRRRWRRLPDAVRREVIREAARGATYAEILARVDVSVGTVTRVLAPLGAVGAIWRRLGWTNRPASLAPAQLRDS